MKKIVVGTLTGLTMATCVAPSALADQGPPQPRDRVEVGPSPTFAPAQARPGDEVTLTFDCGSEGAVLLDKQSANVTPDAAGNRSSLLENIRLTRSGHVYTATMKVSRGAKPGNYTEYIGCPDPAGGTRVSATDLKVRPDADGSDPETPGTRKTPAEPSSGITFRRFAAFSRAEGRPGDKVTVKFGCSVADMTRFLAKARNAGYRPSLVRSESGPFKKVELTGSENVYTGTMEVAPDAKPGEYVQTIGCPTSDDHTLSYALGFVVLPKADSVRATTPVTPATPTGTNPAPSGEFGEGHARRPVEDDGLESSLPWALLYRGH